MMLMQVLKQCGNDLSRRNIMRQATNLKNMELPAMICGMKGQHEPDRLPSDPSSPADALGRPALEAVRRGFRRRAAVLTRRISRHRRGELEQSMRGPGGHLPGPPVFSGRRR
jgi:hypothetical protein